MKYYLIVGEASGDLHASRLMASLRQCDPSAEFRFFGGDLMSAVGANACATTRTWPIWVLCPSCFTCAPSFAT